MTKKHFIALADHIKSSTVDWTLPHLEVLMKFCREQNRLFDGSRWLGYIRGECGPSGGIPHRKVIRTNRHRETPDD
jgi:hypothetical protein